VWSTRHPKKWGNKSKQMFTQGLPREQTEQKTTHVQEGEREKAATQKRPCLNKKKPSIKNRKGPKFFARQGNSQRGCLGKNVCGGQNGGGSKSVGGASHKTPRRWVDREHAMYGGALSLTMVAQSVRGSDDKSNRLAVSRFWKGKK